MSDFTKWQDRYSNGWVTEAQLQRLVVLGVLTEQEYQDIVNPE